MLDCRVFTPIIRGRGRDGGTAQDSEVKGDDGETEKIEIGAGQNGSGGEIVQASS